MDASPSSPRSGESVSEDSAVNYERLARDLLITKLELEATEIRDAYTEVARTLKDGDDIDHEDVEKLQWANTLTRDLLQLVEESMESDGPGGDSR